MPNSKDNPSDDPANHGAQLSRSAFEAMGEGGFSTGGEAEARTDLASALGASVDLSRKSCDFTFQTKIEMDGGSGISESGLMKRRACSPP